MNWLAWDARAFLGAIVGAAAGAAVYAGLLPEHEAPWIVGLGLGLGTAAAARDKSTVRGLVLGAVALWASALAQATWMPQGEGRTWLAEVGDFHASLTAERVALHAFGCLLAGLLAARSLRAGAARRLAGT
jgi:hypothetical protein